MDALNSPPVAVELTESQHIQLLPVFESLRQVEGGVVVAQVWPDGMKVTVLNKAAADAFAEALGGWRSQEIVHSLAESMAKAKPLN
ncbi:MAG: hypothetical protein ACK40L_08520 [Hydrogenophaga sp.]